VKIFIEPPFINLKNGIKTDELVHKEHEECLLFFRFKEREENVKADIFNAYIALLKQTKPGSFLSAFFSIFGLQFFSR